MVPSVTNLPGPSPIATPVLGRGHTTFLEDLGKFGKASENVELSRYDVELARADLRGVLARERNDAALIVKLIEDRRVVGKGILEDLNNVVERLGGLRLVEGSDEEEEIEEEEEEEEERDTIMVTSGDEREEEDEREPKGSEEVDDEA
jgi:hypothetical protein